MSESYFNEYQKCTQSKDIPSMFWDMELSYIMEETFYQKGYRYVRTSLIHDHKGELHNAWVVPREHIGVFVESLFQKRIMVEVEACGHGNAHIIFVNNDSIDRIESVIKSIPKCRRG